jgi:hypothetical protein
MPAGADFHLECGEDRRFGCFSLEKERKAAMLAALL